MFVSLLLNVSLAFAANKPPPLPVYPGAERLRAWDVGVGWRWTYQAQVPPNKVAAWYAKLWGKKPMVIRKVTVVPLILQSLRDKARGIDEKVMVKGVEVRPGRAKGTTLFVLLAGKISEGKELQKVDVKMPEVLKQLPTELTLPLPTLPTQP